MGGPGGVPGGEPGGTVPGIGGCGVAIGTIVLTILKFINWQPADYDLEFININCELGLSGEGFEFIIFVVSLK